MPSIFRDPPIRSGFGTTVKAGLGEGVGLGLEVGVGGREGLGRLAVVTVSGVLLHLPPLSQACTSCEPPLTAGGRSNWTLKAPLASVSVDPRRRGRRWPRRR